MRLIYDILLMVTIMALCFGVGWGVNDLYEYHSNKIQIRGLWMTGFNHSAAETQAYSLDHKGEWICINVNDNMKFQDIVNTCNHEAGHELFARKCSKNPELCLKLMEQYNE